MNARGLQGVALPADKDATFLYGGIMASFAFCEKKQDVFLEKFVINGKYSERRTRNSEDGRRELAHLQALNIDPR